MSRGSIKEITSSPSWSPRCRDARSSPTVPPSGQERGVDFDRRDHEPATHLACAGSGTITSTPRSSGRARTGSCGSLATAVACSPGAFPLARRRPPTPRHACGSSSDRDGRATGNVIASVCRTGSPNSTLSRRPRPSRGRLSAEACFHWPNPRPRPAAARRFLAENARARRRSSEGGPVSTFPNTRVLVGLLMLLAMLAGSPRAALAQLNGFNIKGDMGLQVRFPGAPGGHIALPVASGTPAADPGNQGTAPGDRLLPIADGEITIGALGPAGQTSSPPRSSCELNDGFAAGALLKFLYHQPPNRRGSAGSVSGFGDIFFTPISLGWHSSGRM